jgi:hypothetical protein
MKKKNGRMVPNCVPSMKQGGLTKWFQEKWVDIGAEKEWKVSSLWQSNSSKQKISKMRTTCKSHSNVKVAKGECCPRKRQAPNTGPNQVL